MQMVKFVPFLRLTVIPILIETSTSFLIWLNILFTDSYKTGFFSFKCCNALYKFDGSPGLAPEEQAVPGPSQS